MRLQAVAFTALFSGYSPALMAHPGAHTGLSDSGSSIHFLLHASAVPGALLLVAILFVALKHLSNRSVGHQPTDQNSQ